VLRELHSQQKPTGLRPGVLLNWDGKLCSFSQRYVDILERNGIEWVMLDPDSDHFWSDLGNITHLLFRHTNYDSDNVLGDTFIPLIEKQFCIPCLPNSIETWFYDDKIRQFYALTRVGIPYVQSWAFCREETAREWLRSAPLPLVLKLPKSAGSQNVVLISSKREGEVLLKAIFRKGVRYGELPTSSNLGSPMKSGYRKALGKMMRNWLEWFGWCPGGYGRPYWQIQRGRVLFQEFLPDNPFDTRVTVLGERAFAFRRYNRPGDFRASGSGLIDHSPDKIDMRCVEIAFQASHAFGFQTMAYDFLLDSRRNPVIVEMSYAFVDRPVYECPGYWDEGLTWHGGHLWPQYCHLTDLLHHSALVP